MDIDSTFERVADRARSVIRGRVAPGFTKVFARLRSVAQRLSSARGGWIGLRIAGNILHELLDEFEGALRPSVTRMPEAQGLPQSNWTFGRRWRAGQTRIGNGH